jgi:citrate lyase subunit beta / citryl-CoA lyase
MPPILRSMLFVPGHNRRYLEIAAESNADAIIVDLEDSVPLPAHKAQARIIGREMIENGLGDRHFVYVRVNEPDRVQDDLEAFATPKVRGFMLPKSHDGEDVRKFCALLDDLESRMPGLKRSFTVAPLIETCAAVLHAEQIARASQRVEAIAFGCEDFIADLHGIHDPTMFSLFTPRALIAMAARAAGVIPIDTVHVRVHDLEDLEQNLTLARILGFEGALLLHPKEIDIAHRCFTPTDEEAGEADLVIRETEDAHTEGKGVAWRDGRFLGPPMVRAARFTALRHALIQGWEKHRD